MVAAKKKNAMADRNQLQATNEELKVSYMEMLSGKSILGGWKFKKRVFVLTPTNFIYYDGTLEVRAWSFGMWSVWQTMYTYADSVQACLRLCRDIHYSQAYMYRECHVHAEERTLERAGGTLSDCSNRKRFRWNFRQALFSGEMCVTCVPVTLNKKK